VRGARHAWLPRAVWILGLPGWALVASASEAGTALPRRVREIVIHVPGGPSYTNPARRFRFFDPRETQALWKPRFGAHWIVWTDGSLWPRHPAPGEPASRIPPVDRPADDEWKRRLAADADPVYGHLHNANSHTLGIEVAHSGRSQDPFPREQVRTLAWLLRTLLDMSGGRLSAEQVHGHKDLDRRPAYVQERCAKPGCAVYVDGEGRPFRRRVDPPEGLFAALRAEGFVVRRPPNGDADLIRAEAIPAGARPSVAH